MKTPLLIVLWMFLLATLSGAPAVAAEPSHWRLPQAWSADDALVTEAANWCWAALHGKGAPAVPAAWTQEAPRIAVLACSDGKSTAALSVGHGRTLAEALQQAVAQARAGQAAPPRWLTLDLVQNTWPLDLSAALRVQDFEPGFDGLVFHLTPELLLPPQRIVALDLVGSQGRIDLEQLQMALGPDDARPRLMQQLARQGQLQATAFTTAAAFVDGSESFALYRGHRMDHDLSPLGLRAAAAVAGAYLARSVDEQGLFNYRYEPEQLVPVVRTSDTYNLVRHAGTTYSMFELQRVSPNDALLQSAKRALQHLRTLIKPMAIRGVNTLCLVEDDAVKLGGNALAILAFVEYAVVTGDQRDLETMRGLAEWIMQTQSPGGQFMVHKKIWPDGLITEFESEYYPGEAVLALLRLYALGRDMRHLEAAERGANHLITRRDFGLAIHQLAHDHWLLYALNELAQHRPSPVVTMHAQRLATAIIDAQHRDPPYRDWVGGFYQPPRATPTATRMEGLLAAHRLFARQGDAAMLQQIEPAALAGTVFQLHLQVEPALAMHLPDPPRALGAVRDGFDDVDIRIDYVQHTISALLAAADMLERSPQAGQTPAKTRSKE